VHENREKQRSALRVQHTGRLEHLPVLCHVIVHKAIAQELEVLFAADLRRDNLLELLRQIFNHLRMCVYV
jgi:hypothetical protein